MTPEERIGELRARIELAQGSATLLLAITRSDEALDEAQRVLNQILRATPMAVADLGACAPGTGPARWVELTRSQTADAFTLVFKQPMKAATRAFARLLNAERELLRGLAGPVILLVSRATEKALREQAPDFFTWVAQSYEMPETRELATVASMFGVSVDSTKPKSSPESPIRFLHISDLHLRPQRVKRYDQDRVLQGLITFLEHDRASFPLDMLFVTGDLAQSGQPEEYALVVELLKRLMAVTLVPAERVFVVPGNHDVDREVGRWLLRTPAKSEDAIAFFVEANSRTFHEQKLAAYRNGLSALLGAARPLGLGVGEEAVEIVEIKGARIAVASFNSAWFAQGDDDHGKLWIGEPNVERAAERIADEDALFAIALLHHPFDFLHEIERDTVEHWFERSFELVLRGHLHASKTRSIASQRGGIIEVAGPAAYQGSQWANGCFLGEIRPNTRTIRLRPYMYAAGPDPWVLDTKVFPDDESDGYCRTFTVPEKKRQKSAIPKAIRDTASDRAFAITQESLRVNADDLRTMSLGTTLAGAIATEIESDEQLKKWSAPTATEAFEAMLLYAGRVFLKVTSKFGLRDRLSENTIMFGFAAALKDLVEAPVVIQPRLPDGKRPDIYIAGVGVVEVKRATGQKNVPHVVLEHGLQQLDNYLTRLEPSVLGALVLVNFLPSSATEPQLDHVKTAAGRAVLILRL